MRRRPQNSFSVLVAIGVCFVVSGTFVSFAKDIPVVDAARNQDLQTVRALLENGFDVNERQADGATALHWAVHWNDIGIVRALIDSDADVNATNVHGVTPLSLAAANASPDLVSMLVAAGADPNMPRLNGETPLMRAASTGSFHAVRSLIANGAVVDAVEPESGQTSLMLAVSRRFPEVVSELLESGANVHLRTKKGFTSLLFAAREGDLDSARLLIAAGADVNASMDDGTNALLAAVVRGHASVAVLLLQSGADPNMGATRPRRRATDGASGRLSQDEVDYRPLHWAVGAWQTELSGPNGIAVDRESEWLAIRGVPGDRKRLLVEALLLYGANPNARMRRAPPRFGYSQLSYEHNKQGVDVFAGATPFLLAAMAGDSEVMRILVSGGADPELTTDDGTTPLMVAAGLGRYAAENLVTEKGTLDSVGVALALGADVNAVNGVGNTALHAAAHIKSDALVQLLVDRGAKLNASNSRAETPLMLADRFRAGSGNVHVRTSTGNLLRSLGAEETGSVPAR